MSIYSLKNVNIYIYSFYSADSPTSITEKHKRVQKLEQIPSVSESTSHTLIVLKVIAKIFAFFENHTNFTLELLVGVS